MAFVQDIIKFIDDSIRIIGGCTVALFITWLIVENKKNNQGRNNVRKIPYRYIIGPSLMLFGLIIILINCFRYGFDSESVGLLICIPLSALTWFFLVYVNDQRS